VSARAHPRLIGAFVVLGVGLVLAGIVALSSGTLFEKRERYAVFFPGSVRGLKAGAPVTFRGIPIGEVSDVSGFFTGGEPEIQVEVVIELRSGRIRDATTESLERLPPRDFAQYFIDRGIKAQMLSQSLLTGQKLIELDFYEEEGRLTGLASEYPELPTVPGPLERLGNELGNRVDDVLAKVAQFPIEDVEALVKDVRAAVQSVDDLIQGGSVEKAASGVERSARELEGALSAVNEAGREIGQTAEEMRKELSASSGQLRETLEQANRALTALEEAAAGGRGLPADAARALDELSRSAAALRELLDYLQRHPESLVVGKPEEER
jgi:paraquat-inducible protein B